MSHSLTKRTNIYQLNLTATSYVICNISVPMISSSMNRQLRKSIGQKRYTSRQYDGLTFHWYLLHVVLVFPLFRHTVLWSIDRYYLIKILSSYCYFVFIVAWPFKSDQGQEAVFVAPCISFVSFLFAVQPVLDRLCTVFYCSSVGSDSSTHISTMI